MLLQHSTPCRVVKTQVPDKEWPRHIPVSQGTQPTELPSEQEPSQPLVPAALGCSC